MPTVEEFRAELVGFPRASHNDRVDTTTQALDHLASPYARLAADLKTLK
jgi:phage terminase large subunit-like protein